MMMRCWRRSGTGPRRGGTQALKATLAQIALPMSAAAVDIETTRRESGITAAADFIKPDAIRVSSNRPSH